MDILLILTYVAICVAVFKLFKIPLNKWTVPTAVLGGILLIGGLLTVMNYNHPYSEAARQYFVTTPIVPQVRGRVIEVPVKPNVPLKQGDVLYRIDPLPYQDKVDKLKAQLDGEVAERDRLKEEYDRSLSVFEKGAGSERDVQSWRLRYETAVTDVEEARAQLEEATFDLEETVVRAPEDGFVTQLTIRPGAMAGMASVRPGLLFIPQQKRLLVGWFRQNSLLRLQAGDEAEIIFDAVPGTIFKGEVSHVLPFISEGQMQPTADLEKFVPHPVPGRAAVVIEVKDLADYDLPLGVYAQAAVYTEHFHHLAVIRRVLLRMASWMSYLFPLH